MNWISVKDRLPETEDSYLIWPPNKYAGGVAPFSLYDCREYKKNTFYLESEYGEVSILEEVTHWMPLPDKPAEEG